MNESVIANLFHFLQLAEFDELLMNLLFGRRRHEIPNVEHFDLKTKKRRRNEFHFARRFTMRRLEYLIIYRKRMRTRSNLKRRMENLTFGSSRSSQSKSFRSRLAQVRNVRVR